jgi:hypothetical protein
MDNGYEVVTKMIKEKAVIIKEENEEMMMKE